MSFAAGRRDARERALGLLYEAEAKGVLGVDVLAELPVAPDPFAAALVLAVDEHRERIDGHLARFAQGWTLERMAAIDRAALRMGTAELITRPDVPTGVVLAETVDLASRFSTDGSGRFVNGLLARIAREVRPGAQDVVGSVPDEPPAPLVDGFVIDLDGVIRHWDDGCIGEHEERLGLPPGSIRTAAFEADRLARAMDGRLSFEDWAAEIGAVVGWEHGVDDADVVEAWTLARWNVDLNVIELLQEIRRTVPVALLSNASTRLQDDLEASGIDDAFDAIVGSADIGVAKPDAGAFLAAAGAIGIAVDRCCFVDDLDANVAGARATGMRAERFTDLEALRALAIELRLV